MSGNENVENEQMTPGADDRPVVKTLFENLLKELPELEKLLSRCRDHWAYEDAVYRFYHQSFKVYAIQDLTVEIVSRLKVLLPDVPLNEWFMQIINEGTGRNFASEDNKNWLAIARPMLEAYFHARYFLEMAVKYGKELEYPSMLLPSGWAAFLYLHNLR